MLLTARSRRRRAFSSRRRTFSCSGGSNGRDSEPFSVITVPRLNAPRQHFRQGFQNGPCPPVRCGTNGFVDATSNRVARWVLDPTGCSLSGGTRALVATGQIHGPGWVAPREHEENQCLGARRQGDSKFAK